jgi:hypothetical protein
MRKKPGGRAGRSLSHLSGPRAVWINRGPSKQKAASQPARSREGKDMKFADEGKALMDKAYLTEAERARAISVYRMYTAVQGAGGYTTAMDDWRDAIQQTISERGDPKSPYTEEQIQQTVCEVYGRKPTTDTIGRERLMSLMTRVSASGPHTITG